MTGEGCHEDRPWLLSKEKASGKGKITDKLTVPCLEGGALTLGHICQKILIKGSLSWRPKGKMCVLNLYQKSFR